MLSLLLLAALPSTIIASPLLSRGAVSLTCYARTEVIAGRSCTFKCGTDYPGGDYAAVRVDSLENCGQSCAADKHCTDAQYNRDNSYCYMKKTLTYERAVGNTDSVICDPIPIPSETPASTTPSSTPSSTPAPVGGCPITQTLYNGRTCKTSCFIDRHGGDYASKYTGSLQACLDACGGDAKCITAQFNHNSGFCYMKSESHNAVESDDTDTVDCSPAADTPTCASICGAVTTNTITVTSTATSTPDGVTSTVTVTSENEAVTSSVTIDAVTSTTTVTQTVSSVVSTSSVTTTTSTLSMTTSTLSCLTAAFTANPNPVPQKVAAPPKMIKKRSEWSPADCGCPVPSVSTYVTVTTTLVAATQTNTATVTSQPVTTVTVTPTSYSTVQETSVSTTVTTSVTTVTEYVQATQTVVQTSYLDFRRYSHSYSDSNLPSFSADTFKGVTAPLSGYLYNPNFSAASNSAYTVTAGNGISYASTQTAWLMQGFFVAPTTGTYTFSTNSAVTDNWNYLWLGDKAYSAWSNANSDYRVAGPCTTQCTKEVKSSTVALKQGDAVPATFLWANSGGPGVSHYVISGVSSTGGSIFMPSRNFARSCDRATTFP